MISKIHILNGPNLNLLGKREVDIYGNMPFEHYFEQLRKEFVTLELTYFQSNHEGDLIDHLQQCGFDPHTGFILNAAGLSHTSISLRDTVAAIPAPVVEVHISDIRKREDFRKHSYLTEVSASHFIGMGLEGYREGIMYLQHLP